ncbi:hypothetical protein niasHS_008134 [Heterodera schachtii]|uniref:Uncharacterized protein n=2 Tax=Heterodera TaxID=34509 RepID=A0ABD2J1U0_HETSC
MSARFRQAFLRLLSGKKQFINSYKRDSVCAPTANGKMMMASIAAPRYRACRTTSAGTPAAAAADADDASANRSVPLSRMTSADAETRATLLLSVQRNGNNTTTCHHIIVPTNDVEEEDSQN